MNRKIIQLIIVSLLSTIVCFGQIHVGSNDMVQFNKAKDISEADLAKFKKSTTLFTLQFKDYAEQAVYEKMLQSVWTVTKFKVVRPDELAQYQNQDGYSLFMFGGYAISSSRNTNMANNIQIYYGLSLLDGKKQKSLAHFILSPDPPTITETMKRFNSSGKKEFSNKMTAYFYNDAVFYNWGPGIIKGYLKDINDLLLAGKKKGQRTQESDAKALAQLKNDTLYIPDYLFARPNRQGDITMDEASIASISDVYPYPIKVLPVGVINNKIVNEQASFLYIMVTLSSGEKYVNVFESTSGKLLFSDHRVFSFAFKNKDLEYLSKLIK